MMSIEFISRRRRTYSNSPAGMTPKWSRTTIEQNDVRKKKIKTKPKPGSKTICGRFFQRNKRMKSSSNALTTAKSDSRGRTNMASPMTYICSFKKMMRYFNATSSYINYDSVLVRHDVIGGELTIVNEMRVQSAYDNQDYHITLNSMLSPPNYGDTINYYQHINYARQTCLQVALRLGDLLERGWVKGDAEDWVKYLERIAEEEKEWKEKCRYSHEQRKLAIRYVYDDDTETSLCWRMCGWSRTSKSLLVAAIALCCRCFRSKRGHGEQLL